MNTNIRKRFSPPWYVYYLVSAVLLGAFVLALWFMGQPLICECGYVQIWHSGVGEQSSKHLFDWYSLSHVIHGFIFYGLISWLFPSWPRIARITVAIIPEVAWELIENSPWVIEYYRTQTAAAQYAGDSVVNSLMDVVSMIAGAIYARYFPVWSTIALVILLELAALWAVRDNLTLNVLMFIHPFEAIREWQSGR